MSAVELVTSTFQIGAKGRAVIPVAVRRAANIHENDTLVAHVNALGQVVIETEEALKARLWAAAAQAAEVVDPTSDVRAMREADSALSDLNHERRRQVREQGSDERGAALLAHLGL